MEWQIPYNLNINGGGASPPPHLKIISVDSMSTFYHSDSPLINGQSFPQIFSSDQNTLSDQYNAYKQQMMENYLAQQNMNQTSTHDYLNELDILTKDLEKDALERLNSDTRYIELNTKLQAMIQEEIMNIVKVKINNNTEMVNNIKEEIEIITKIKNEVKEEERNNYYEMQDYLKNFSHLTFDDYRNLKNKKMIEKEN